MGTPSHISGVRWWTEGLDAKGAGKLVGILTNRDVRFAADPRQKVSELMTKDKLITVREGVKSGRGQAAAAPAPASRRSSWWMTPIAASGLITVKDIEKAQKYPQRLQGRARAVFVSPQRRALVKTVTRGRWR